MRGSRLVILALLLPAFAAGRSEARPAPAARQVQEIQFASSEADLETGSLLTEANFAQLRDLWIRVVVSKMPPKALLTVAFLTPAGEPFYETNRFYSRLPQVTSTVAPKTGGPAVVYSARKLPAGYALDLPVAIAGSVFLRYPAPGTWSVRVKVGESGEILSKTLAVSVNP